MILSSLNLRENEDFLKYIQTYKTGALFVASCLIGGIIGGADNKKLNILKEFAESFGVAFQMADDILDVISTSKEMGKTTGKDDKENKLTYVKKYGLENAKEKLNSQIKKTYDILKNNQMESEVFVQIIDSMTAKIF